MIDVGIQVVDTDGIDAHNLHESSISHARLGLTERIRARVCKGRAAAWLVSNANDLELVASLGVVELIALDIKGRNGNGQRRSKRVESKLNLMI